VSPTPVGVDVGEKTLVAAGTPGMAVEDVRTVDGAPLRRAFRRFAAMQRAFAFAHWETGPAETMLTAAVWVHRLKPEIYDAAHQAVAFARQFTAPVVVLEALEQPMRPLWAYRRGQRDFGDWLLPVLQQALVEVATDAGVPVAWVDPRGTSRECHRCGQAGELENETLDCRNLECPVTVVDRDRSAAVSIARRLG
jgi:IS605 OrfB family transposase